MKWIAAARVMEATVSKTTIRWRNSLMAWNPSGDPEWRYRKTLDKKERDEFDALDITQRVLIVQTWAQSQQ